MLPPTAAAAAAPPPSVRSYQPVLILILISPMKRLRTGLKLVAAREVAATRAAPPATMVTPATPLQLFLQFCNGDNLESVKLYPLADIAVMFPQPCQDGSTVSVTFGLFTSCSVVPRAGHNPTELS